jgi:hypothetical protein
LANPAAFHPSQRHQRAVYGQPGSQPATHMLVAVAPIAWQPGSGAVPGIPATAAGYAPVPGYDPHALPPQQPGGAYAGQPAAATFIAPPPPGYPGAAAAAAARPAAYKPPKEV